MTINTWRVLPGSLSRTGFCCPAGWRVRMSVTPMANQSADTVWKESRDTQSGYVRCEARTSIHSEVSIRFNSYYSWFNPDVDVIDRTFKQDETTLFGELVVDMPLFKGKGLVSSGLSFRRKEVDDALIWEDFFLDFLSSDNEFFLPFVTQSDYTTRLWSGFAQYRHRIGKIDLWAGIRLDDHDSYEDNVSHNLGMTWSPTAQWQFKVLYGTAYRTPFARQLLKDTKPELEEITSVNLQAMWSPLGNLSLRCTGFVSRIEDHIKDDPFAGLSLPNHQDFQGVEIDGTYSPHPTLDLQANITWVDHSGPHETYEYNDYDIIGGNGEIIPHYIDVSYPLRCRPGKAL